MHDATTRKRRPHPCDMSLIGLDDGHIARYIYLVIDDLVGAMATKKTQFSSDPE